MSHYIRRWTESEYELAATVFKAIIFSGVRQCGKTTLMQAVLPKDSAYVTLDSVQERAAAQEAPEGFLMRFRRHDCLAIDEVQKAPGLFQEIKAFADASPILRHFLLSGSSNYKALPTVHESMAGRLGEVRIRPLTEGEIQGNAPNFITRLLEGNFSKDFAYDECNKDLILQKAIRGGFPHLLEFTERQRNYWFDAYVDALVKKDFLELGDFRKPRSVDALLKLCAANSAHPFNLSQAASALELNRLTLTNYMDALQTMFLIDRIPAWQPRVADRVGKASKLVLCDTGLMSFLSGINASSLLSAPQDKAKTDLIGNLIETWVYQQLAPITDLGREWRLFHFRNAAGKEIDYVLENRCGDLICIEVKASESAKSDHFKDLRWFRKQFGPERKITSVVLYCGRKVFLLSENEVALPMAYLWD
jgi:hypothetical protein